MRSDDAFEVRLLKRPHKFFVYWIGRPDYHIMNWRGCNFHWVKAESQPRDGFDTPWDAYLWADKRIMLQREDVMREIGPKSGSHLGDSIDRYVSDIVYNPDGSRQFSVHCPLYCDEHQHAYVDPPAEWWHEYDEWVREKKTLRESRTERKSMVMS